MHGVTMT